MIECQNINKGAKISRDFAASDNDSRGKKPSFVQKSLEIFAPFIPASVSVVCQWWHILCHALAPINRAMCGGVSVFRFFCIVPSELQQHLSIRMNWTSGEPFSRNHVKAAIKW